jgi:hypothetical protein
MSDLSLALSVPLAQAADSAFAAKDALMTLVTVETFLFGFITIVIGVMTPTPRGNKLIASPKAFAVCTALLITVVGLGSAIAWLDLFVKWKGVFEGEWPDHAGGVATAVAIAIAIVGPVVLVWWIVGGVKNPTSNDAPVPGAGRVT